MMSGPVPFCVLPRSSVLLSIGKIAAVCLIQEWIWLPPERPGHLHGPGRKGDGRRTYTSMAWNPLHWWSNHISLHHTGLDIAMVCRKWKHLREFNVQCEVIRWSQYGKVGFSYYPIELIGFPVLLVGRIWTASVLSRAWRDCCGNIQVSNATLILILLSSRPISYTRNNCATLVSVHFGSLTEPTIIAATWKKACSY